MIQIRPTPRRDSATTLTNQLSTSYLTINLQCLPFSTVISSSTPKSLDASLQTQKGTL